MSEFPETLVWHLNSRSSKNPWEIYAISVFCVFRVYQLANGTFWYRCDHPMPRKNDCIATVEHVRARVPLELPHEIPDTLPLQEFQARAQRLHARLRAIVANASVTP